MPLAGIDARPVADPYLICITSGWLFFRFHTKNLTLQLVLDPQIIGIQETDKLPAGMLDPHVSSFGNATILGHAKIPDTAPGLDHGFGIVSGTVIDDDQLVIPECLRRYRIYSVAQTKASVKSRDNDGNRRIAIIHRKTFNKK